MRLSSQAWEDVRGLGFLFMYRLQMRFWIVKKVRPDLTLHWFTSFIIKLIITYIPIIIDNLEWLVT